MKAKDLDQPEGGWTTLATIPSDTTAEVYRVQWAKEFGYRCDCLGFKSSRMRPKSCKHIARFQIRTALEDKLLDAHFDHVDISSVVSIVMDTLKERHVL